MPGRKRIVARKFKDCNIRLAAAALEFNRSSPDHRVPVPVAQELNGYRGMPPDGPNVRSDGILHDRVGDAARTGQRNRIDGHRGNVIVPHRHYRGGIADHFVPVVPFHILSINCIRRQIRVVCADNLIAVGASQRQFNFTAPFVHLVIQGRNFHKCVRLLINFDLKGKPLLAKKITFDLNLDFDFPRRSRRIHRNLEHRRLTLDDMVLHRLNRQLHFRVIVQHRDSCNSFTFNALGVPHNVVKAGLNPAVSFMHTVVHRIDIKVFGS